MAAWHADITRVLMYIVYNNRLALPEDWTQNAYSLDRSQMSEVLLDGGGCTRDSNKVELCQLFCPLLQVCNQSRATFVSGLDHIALHSNNTRCDSGSIEM